ncbi:hypothetical protein CCACVL1_09969 [Corchorus capsularis]|uniref:CCDC93 coiled-coil domain-containing protein n=1 Tax=Corchorus capsularis TaxID=210143 RepID=A0A1R3ITC6_COCAP|nr:hypothetical protein CCACVL1_09969 [Corchorus capsularis]
MFRDVSSCNTYNYGDSLYWDSCYVQEAGGAFDWYQRSLRPFIRNYIPTSSLALMTLERQESENRSDFDAKRSSLEAEISDLEEKMATGSDSEMLSHGLDDSLDKSVEKLNSAKELAARLRAVVSVKRGLDDVPSQSELVQKDFNKLGNSMLPIVITCKSRDLSARRI